MNANPILLKKICTHYRTFCKRNHLTLEESLDFFYRSDLYQLLKEGCSDMHCMSDQYLTQDLTAELLDFNSSKTDS